MAEIDSPENIIDVEEAPDIPETDSVEEEHGETGIAGRFLRIAGLLVLGGALALWLGPKIAPTLPVGMAPVAAWLAPGGAKINADIAMLRDELASISEPVSSFEIEAMISGVISTNTTALLARIDALGQGSDNTEFESRLATLELQSEGLRAQVSTLLTQLSDVSQIGGQVSAETAAKLAAFAAVNEGLRAEIISISNRIDGVSANAAQVSVVESNAEEERNAATIQNSLITIDVALTAGLPYRAALTDLENAGILDIPITLVDAAGGIATMAKLRADFPEAAHAAIRASIKASAGEGVFAAIGAFTKAQVAGRSLTPQAGVGPDAVLSRAEAALKQGSLDVALIEIDALPAASLLPENTNPMSKWLANALQRQDAINGFERLQDSLTRN